MIAKTKPVKNTIKKSTMTSTYRDLSCENWCKSVVISCSEFPFMRVWRFAHLSHSGSGPSQVLQHLVASALMVSRKQGLHAICIWECALSLLMNKAWLRKYCHVKIDNKKHIHWSRFFLFLCDFSSHSRISHSYGDASINECFVVYLMMIIVLINDQHPDDNGKSLFLVHI